MISFSLVLLVKTKEEANQLEAEYISLRNEARRRKMIASEWKKAERQFWLRTIDCITRYATRPITEKNVEGKSESRSPIEKNVTDRFANWINLIKW